MGRRSLTSTTTPSGASTARHFGAARNSMVLGNADSVLTRRSVALKLTNQLNIDTYDGGSAMKPHPVVARDRWMSARKELLVREKEFTRLRDELSRERRALPWTRVETSYVFDSPNGPRTLADLFDGRSQLIVYHFMFGPNWKEGCKSCSFWADNFDGIAPHLEQRDVSLVVVSRAPLDALQAFRQRMGWRFLWVSSLGSDFNRDFHVSFAERDVQDGNAFYNYERRPFPSDEAPGVSVFYRDRAGAIFHTYSCYARGLDMLNAAYQYLDLVPKGRDEANMPYTMAWVRHHDRYGV
jgi:predicted dithiol-disulfide oxidoreductase (DUF899 family)